MEAFHEGNVKTGPRVVVAEDDADLRSRLRSVCAGLDTWSGRRPTAAQVLTLVRAHVPDLLLLDIWMPVLNGLEVVEQLGETSEAVGLKIVVLSYLTDADTHLEGYALGVDDYWTKDLSVGDLVERIERLMLAGTDHPCQTG